MHPYLIDFGEVSLPFLGPFHLALPSYGAMLALALGIGWFLFQREVARLRLPIDTAMGVVFWTILAGLLSGKLGLVIVEWRSFVAHPARFLTADFLQSAGVVWTGVLGALATMVALMVRARLPVWTMLDATALPLPIAQAIGRVGCLLAGCCFGARCEWPWAIYYHSRLGHERSGVPLAVPLHPAPLYEAAWNLFVVVPLVVFVRSRQKRHGEAVLAYFSAYGLGRFFIEFTRGDAVRGAGLLAGLSTSQLISAVVLPIALAFWWWLRATATAPLETAPDPPPPDTDGTANASHGEPA